MKPISEMQYWAIVYRWLVTGEKPTMSEIYATNS